jgi:glycosyltransferase involved in cell wall biosynthesis
MRDALRPTLAGRLVARIIGAEADAIVAISRYVAQEVRVPAGTVHVLHNAIDPCQYRFSPDKGSALRRRLGIPQEAPLLAVVGQISPWKGQHEAIEALAAVRKACPATHLLVAGSVKFLGAHCRYDNQEYYDALVARSQDPDVAGFVHLAGEVGDAGAIYSAADALLVPSWAEPFGRIVIEAMAARCPVIATAAGGVPEIMTHGVNGLLVAPRDPAALAGAALTLLRDAALRDALAHNAYEMVAERFSMADYTLHMQDIWTKTSTHGRK